MGGTGWNEVPTDADYTGETNFGSVWWKIAGSSESTSQGDMTVGGTNQHAWHASEWSSTNGWSTNPYDVRSETGDTDNQTSVYAGAASLTPTQDSALMIVGMRIRNLSAAEVGNASLDSSYTIYSADDNFMNPGAASLESFFGYKILTSASAQNPQFSWTTTGSNNVRAHHVAFLDDEPASADYSKIIDLGARKFIKQSV